MFQCPSVDEIKRLYPHPIVATLKPNSASYCVGGACIQALEPVDEASLPDYEREARHFPDSERLANVLMLANPHLAFERALDFADYIITRNDFADFEDAWLELTYAFAYAPLSYTPDEGKP